MSAELDLKARGKREETKASNRQAIIDAARRVFAELGYGATTVRDIIRATELASGTFYNYFKSKEEVYQALRDETALRVRPRLRAERIRARNFEEFISGSFRTFFDFVKSDQATFASMRRNPDMQHVRIDTPEVIAGFDELRADLEVAMRGGLVPDTDADLLMATIVGVAFEVANHMISRDDLSVDDAAKFATALFLGGVPGLPKRKHAKR
ncbi:MAG: TetR/AcrR family transcriptional regulator [Alphaproteobacteria bacterium]|jgi:AcrR family transcriptional regulator|nr:TetR/AcrR family transcriptional regulator [Alphaproteobacteria bacterium]